MICWRRICHPRVALHFRIRSRDLIGQATARGNLAILDFHLGDLLAAREGHLAALALEEELGNRPGMCATEFNLGEVFFAWENGRRPRPITTKP